MRTFLKIAACVFALTGPGFAQGIEAESGRAMVEGWAAAVATGDAEKVAAVLAPEFQLLRSNGSAHNRDSYIAGGFPAFSVPPTVIEVVESGSGDIRVVRYLLAIDEQVGDTFITRRAPRLTVFRRMGGAWYVVAHANFSQALD